MGLFLTLVKKELLLYFITPVGYIFLAIFFALNGWYLFSSSLLYGTNDLTGVFASIYSTNLYLLPILTMNLFTSEKRQKTHQLITATGISHTNIVLSKLTATFIIYFFGTLVTLFYGITFLVLGNFSFSLFFIQWIGSLCLGLFFLSICSLISSLAWSQGIALVGSFGGLYLLHILHNLPLIKDTVFLYKLARFIMPLPHYKNFVSGFVGVDDFSYFLLGTLVSISLICLVHQKRKRV